MKLAHNHFCATNSEVISVTQEGCQFFERVGYHDFEGIVLVESESPRLLEAMGPKTILWC